MAIVYFDSSALVKLLVEEPGSDVAAALWDGCDVALSSRLAYPEVCAALSAVSRNRAMNEEALTSCRQAWEQYWMAMRPVELTARVAKAAGRVAERRDLRGADAIHLASALEVAIPDLVMAVWDRRLHAGAIAEHISVAPRDLPG